jgi:hypothetical protein
MLWNGNISVESMYWITYIGTYIRQGTKYRILKAEIAFQILLYFFALELFLSDSNRKQGGQIFFNAQGSTKVPKMWRKYIFSQI